MLRWTIHCRHNFSLPKYQSECSLSIDWPSFIVTVPVAMESSESHVKSFHHSRLLAQPWQLEQWPMANWLQHNIIMHNIIYQSIYSSYYPQTLDLSPLLHFHLQFYCFIVFSLYEFNTLLSLLIACSILLIQSTFHDNGREIFLAHLSEQFLPYLKKCFMVFLCHILKFNLLSRK